MSVAVEGERGGRGERGPAAVEVGELLSRLRLARGMSQEQLASASGTGVRSIGDIERGRVARPQHRTLTALAGALDLTSTERDQLLRVGRLRPRNRRRIAPSAVAPMVGRGADLDQITRLLTVGGARLVTVVGPAGVGKSHLAAAVLDRLGAARTFTVDGHGGGLPGVLADLDRATGSTSALPATVDTRVAAIGRDRTGILVDGVDPAPDLSRALAELLARCPGLQLILTARTAVRIRGEHRWPVAGLAGPDAVALLVDRAERVRPGYAGATARPESGELAAIVDRLAGNPLAIEIVAALLRGRDATDLNATLATVLPASGGDPVPALLRWRIGRLPLPSRAALTVLSRHPAGVAAVDGGVADDWDDIVSVLVGAALVRVADRGGQCWLRVPAAVREAVADIHAGGPGSDG